MGDVLRECQQALEQWHASISTPLGDVRDFVRHDEKRKGRWDVLLFGQNNEEKHWGIGSRNGIRWGKEVDHVFEASQGRSVLRIDWQHFSDFSKSLCPSQSCPIWSCEIWTRCSVLTHLKPLTACVLGIQCYRTWKWQKRLAVGKVLRKGPTIFAVRTGALHNIGRSCLAALHQILSSIYQDRPVSYAYFKIRPWRPALIHMYDMSDFLAPIPKQEPPLDREEGVRGFFLIALIVLYSFGDVFLYKVPSTRLRYVQFFLSRCWMTCSIEGIKSIRHVTLLSISLAKSRPWSSGSSASSPSLIWCSSFWAILPSSKSHPIPGKMKLTSDATPTSIVSSSATDSRGARPIHLSMGFDRYLFYVGTTYHEWWLDRYQWNIDQWLPSSRTTIPLRSPDLRSRRILPKGIDFLS